jgi:hypothetical protein
LAVTGTIALALEQDFPHIAREAHARPVPVRGAAVRPIPISSSPGNWRRAAGAASAATG